MALHSTTLAGDLEAEARDTWHRGRDGLCRFLRRPRGGHNWRPPWLLHEAKDPPGVIRYQLFRCGRIGSSPNG